MPASHVMYKRLQTYQEADADVLYSSSLTGKEDIAAVAAAVSGPVRATDVLELHHWLYDRVASLCPAARNTQTRCPPFHEPLPGRSACLRMFQTWDPYHLRPLRGLTPSAFSVSVILSMASAAPAEFQDQIAILTRAVLFNFAHRRSRLAARRRSRVGKACGSPSADAANSHSLS